MRMIALGLLLAGLSLDAQPELLTRGPAVMARCAPQYTLEAKRAGIEGTVVLNIHVYPDGRARDVKVQSSLGSGLDEKAIAAVKQWQFSPGMKDGRAVVIPGTIEVKFRLNELLDPCRAGPTPSEPKPQNGRA